MENLDSDNISPSIMERGITLDIIMAALEIGKNNHVGNTQIDDSAGIGVSGVEENAIRVFITEELPENAYLDNGHIKVSKAFLPITNTEETIKSSVITFTNLDLDSPESINLMGKIIDALVESLYRGKASTVRTLSSMQKIFANGYSVPKIDKSSELGLYGEMFFIAQSVDMDKLIEGWHNNPKDTFDFIVYGKNIEIKTTSKISREHSFSNTQISEESIQDTYIASIFATAADEGLGETISALYNKINRSLAKAENKVKLKSIIIETLGVSPDLLNKQGFNAEAKDIDLYEACDIPKIAIEHRAITHVKWTVSLKDIEERFPLSDNWLLNYPLPNI
jgi:hypothetical protein